jgi:ribonuclease J
MTDKTESSLVFVPLGGSGEIGMNLNLYGFGPPDARDWIICDCGVTFGEEEATPGVDLILPDPGFIVERRARLLGLVLTHGHEDHIGAVPHLWPSLRCPIYATPFTTALVRRKLDEAGLGREVELVTVPLGGHLDLGPFALDFISLTHSIPEPNALAIRTPLGTVLHTGDWKLDPEPLVGQMADEGALRALGQEGVLAMICDSTNVFQEGHSGSEEEVRASLTALMGGISGRIAVTAFASNVARVETIARAAAAHGRHPVLVGRSMHRIVEVARETGYLAAMPPILREEEGAWLAPDKVCYICTGSQGEPRAALMRIAEGSHPHLTLDPGDTVIFSSRIIPGNERAIFRLQNLLAQRGVRIITERDHFVHVSGHPYRDELRSMYGWVQPKIAVPVHGEMRHLLEHADLAKSLQVPETVVALNGSVIQLAPGAAHVVEQVPSGRLYLDGDVLIPERSGAVQDRRRISVAGYVGVVLVVDRRGDLAAPPSVIVRGLPEQEEGLVAGEIAAAVEDVWEKAEGSEEAVRRAARRVVRLLTGKKPLFELRVVRLA